MPHARPILIRFVGGLAGALRTERLEPRLLLIGELRVERGQRTVYSLHRLQHGLEPRFDRFQTRRRRQQIVRWTGLEHLGRLRGRVLQIGEAYALRVGEMQRAFELVGRPTVGAGLRRRAALRQRSATPAALALILSLILTLILAERGQPRLLL